MYNFRENKIYPEEMWTTDLQPPRPRMDRHILYCKDEAVYEKTLETLSKTESVYFVKNKEVKPLFIVTRGRDPRKISDLKMEGVSYLSTDLATSRNYSGIPFLEELKAIDLISRCLNEEL